MHGLEALPFPTLVALPFLPAAVIVPIFVFLGRDRWIGVVVVGFRWETGVDEYAKDWTRNESEKKPPSGSRNISTYSKRIDEVRPGKRPIGYEGYVPATEIFSTYKHMYVFYVLEFAWQRRTKSGHSRSDIIIQPSVEGPTSRVNTIFEVRLRAPDGREFVADVGDEKIWRSFEDGQPCEIKIHSAGNVSIRIGSNVIECVVNHF